MSFTPIEAWPECLRSHYETQLSQIDSSALPADFLAEETTQRVLACSQFVMNYVQRFPQLIADMQASGVLTSSLERGDLERRYQAILNGLPDDEDECLMQAMRQFRNREMVRIAWRDIAGTADMVETTRDLSWLAEVMLDLTLARLHERLALRFGEPCNAAGEPQKMVVIAMGKLGAHELNFSSDIDLIFAFPEGGQTNGEGKVLDNQAFFIKLGKRLIKVFNETTCDGFVFRVDMRLRPFGQSGALVLSFGAMEDYYVSHAREWERYAMIKANIAAGDKQAGAELMNMLCPFVFRRYLDFGAYQSIREMKAMIDREVLSKGITTDVKVGRGGIREVEFIGQTFQLLRGGNEPSLQARRILDILSKLASHNLITKKEAADLIEAYTFLRDTEHRIQEIADQQTQALPTSDLDQARIAIGMGFPNWEEFLTELARHRGRVSRCFAEILRTENEQETDVLRNELVAVWLDDTEDEQAIAHLKAAGFAEAETNWAQLTQLKHHAERQKLNAEPQKRLDRLMPLVLGDLAGLPAKEQVETMDRVMKLIQSIMRRSVYVALLKEHPGARELLIRLCAASPWIASYITRYPILLDDLIDQNSLFAPPDQSALAIELHDQLIHIHEDDLERQMDALRQFKHSQVLRVAAADMTGHLPLAEVSNHLSAIAEVVLNAATQLAWRELTERFGEPTYHYEGEEKIAHFAVIAYGKLGGLELGYGSDLDVVFIHDSQGEKAVTNGKKSLDNTVFFNRLGQRVIHILTALTPAGRTYEIDTRLRPSGNSGFLVTSLQSFVDYQHKQAWTWEHQALVRARAVAGDESLQARFTAIRAEVLRQARDQQTLQKAVREMREKMRSALVKAKKDQFDLKQGLGGMADIEFIVQYSVLRWASDYPDLLVYTDNLRLLEILARLGLLQAEQCTLLRDAYFAYRADGHRLALQDQSALVSEKNYQDYRAGVITIWTELLEV